MGGVIHPVLIGQHQQLSELGRILRMCTVLVVIIGTKGIETIKVA